MIERRNFYDEIREFERKLISEALVETQGNQARAARILGLSPTTLSSQLKRLGIEASNFRQARRVTSYQDFEKFLLWKTNRL